MTVAFGSAVSVKAPCLYDTDPSQATGASVTGIGLSNDDGDSITGMPDQRLGGVVALHHFETDGNLGTP